jgi:hypothetical protein
MGNPGSGKPVRAVRRLDRARCFRLTGARLQAILALSGPWFGQALGGTSRRPPIRGGTELCYDQPMLWSRTSRLNPDEAVLTR